MPYPERLRNLIEKVEAVNGYINFFADVSNYSKLVLETAIDLSDEYGFIKTDKPEMSWLSTQVLIQMDPSI